MIFECTNCVGKDKMCVNCSILFLEYELNQIAKQIKLKEGWSWGTPDKLRSILRKWLGNKGSNLD